MVISSRDGATVREILAGQAGGMGLGRMDQTIGRVFWDLRYEPVGSETERLPGREGPPVLPGDYNVLLHVEGVDVVTKTVRVIAADAPGVSDDDRRRWHDTALMLHRMQKSALDAAGAVARISDHLGSLASRAGPRRPSASALDAVRRRVQEIAGQLGVAPGRPASGAGRGALAQTLTGRVGLLKQEVLESTSRPTEAQMSAANELRATVTKSCLSLNEVITSDLPPLRKALAADGLGIPALHLAPIAVAF
jgi:hypothetical protein